MFAHFKKRSYQKELMDDLSLSSEELGQNLRELRLVNKYLGGNLVLKTGLHQLKKAGFFRENRVYTVADIGSGGGDNLVVMAQWFEKNEIRARFTGIDANAFMIQFAKEHCQSFGNISFLQQNIFDTTIKQHHFDLTTCSLFCHHFTDEELTAIFKNIRHITHHYFIINDLHRHPLAYAGIWWLTRLLKGSYLIQNDAPLSVMRAFKRKEMNGLVRPIFKNATTQWIWAFRWLVIASVGEEDVG